MVQSQPSSEKRVAICILAMHRSGSSALTRIINLLGYDLGATETLMPAKPDNPAGFWEQEPITSLNDRMLQDVGRQWDSIWPLSKNAISWLQERYREEIRSVVSKIFGNEPRIVWKDPRSLLLMEIWVDALKDIGLTIKCILSVRHPGSVASSLAKRNGFTLRKGVAIWAAYHARFAKIATSLPTAVIDYEALLSGWRLELGRVFNDLDECWPVTIPEAEIDEFLREDLQHNRSINLNESDFPFSFPVLDLYMELMAWNSEVGFSSQLLTRVENFIESSEVVAYEIEANSLERAELKERFLELQAAYRALEGVYHRSQMELDKVSPEGRKSEKLLEMRPVEIQRDPVPIVPDEMDEYVEYSRGAIASDTHRLVRENERLASENQRLTVEAVRLGNLVERISKDHAQALDRLAELENTIANLNESGEELTALRDAYGALERWAKDLHTEHHQACLQRDLTIRDINQLVATKSWKITAPLRSADFGIRMAGRIASVAVKESANALTTLREEGVRGVLRKSKNRYRNEQQRMLGVGVEQDILSNQMPLTLSSQQEGIVPVDQKAAFVDEQRARLKEFLDSEEKLDFTPLKSPRLAVLLVLFNRAELTLACLRSLVRAGEMSLELIIIDNCSTDETAQLLDRIRGARIIRNRDNRHFLLACNQARDFVESEMLLFLNNDAQILPGALKSALSVFESESGIGAVGGKILLLDGTLQEAGSIVWRNGSCLGYGRTEDPNAPEYNFRRDVDFCSGAFLMTPSALFRDLGGFDERFAPAYYEETDYCMRLKALGYRVVYEPRAAIRHFEFASSEKRANAIDLQIRNATIFREIHENALADHHEASLQNVLKARYASPGRRKLLYIDDRVPHAEFGSGYPRARMIVNVLESIGFDITLVALNFPHEDTFESAHTVVSPRTEVMLGIGRDNLNSLLTERRGYYDVVWVSRPDNMLVLNRCLLKNPNLLEGVRIVYDAEAIFAFRDLAKSQLQGAPMSQVSFDKMLSRELALIRHADDIVSVSQHEAKIFETERPDARIVVVGHAVEVFPTRRSFLNRSDLLFVGNLQHDESPNVDSVVWFVSKVFPLIRSMIPDANLHLVGRTGSRLVEKLKQTGVMVHGQVDDLSQWYDRCRVFVAPTRFSAGIPLKVVEAASFGIPAVITSVLAAQLEWVDGAEVISTPPQPDVEEAAFAKAVVQIYTDEVLWDRVRNGAISRVKREYSHASVRDALWKLLNCGTDEGGEVRVR